MGLILYFFLGKNRVEMFLRGGCLGKGVVSALLGAGVGPEFGWGHGWAGVWALGMVATAWVGRRSGEFVEVALWYRWKVRRGFMSRRWGR